MKKPTLAQMIPGENRNANTLHRSTNTTSRVAFLLQLVKP